MQINQIWDWVSYVANGYQSGKFNAVEFNTACQVVAIELFNVKAGLPEGFKPGAPYVGQQYGVNDKITDDLSPFINHHFIINKNAAGYFPKPANYYTFSSLSFNYIENSKICNAQPTSVQRFIKLMNDSEWRVRIGNSIIPPTVEYPIAKVTNQGFQVAPTNITQIFLTYLQAPVPPVYGYTIVNDEYIYDPLTSTQLDFPEVLHPEFAMRIVRYLGINLRDTDLEQLAEQRIISGQ